MSGKANGRKSIYITGAASGIGRATALLFHENGWFVGAADVNAENLQSLEKELGAANCITRKLDVRDNDDFEKALNEFGQETDGKLDIMFNNAGVGVGAYIDDMKFEDIMRVIGINFVGVVSGIRAALPLLKTTPESLVFSTCSSGACFGMPHSAIYSATKSAVKGLTESMSNELRRHGVRAADVLPGFVATAILGKGADYLPKEGMFRAIEPIEIARVVWAAYNTDKNRLHWFVPEEMGEMYRDAANDPEAMRQFIVTDFAKILAPLAKARQNT